jgi:hypothetical protein
MSISFTTEPEDPMDKGYLVEDASNEEQVDFKATFEEEEEEMGDDKSITSASEFEGDIGELTERMLFGELECRAVFTLKWDGGKFHRVCGCHALRLSMQGRGLDGTYEEPVKARRYITLHRLQLSSKNAEPV